MALAGIVGERAAEMDREQGITGKSVLKCAGCKMQVCLEEKTCNSLYYFILLV